MTNAISKWPPKRSVLLVLLFCVFGMAFAESFDQVWWAEWLGGADAGYGVARWL